MATFLHTGLAFVLYLCFIYLPTSNGQSQDLICRLQADICFVVDSSGSINDRDPGNWRLVLKFMKDVVDTLDVGREKTRIAVVRFANRGRVIFNLNDYSSKEDIKNAIDKMSYIGGNTNTSGGIRLMIDDVFNTRRNEGDRPNIANTAIVITDGKSTYDQEKTVPYAREAQSKGVKMIGIGVTDQINLDELTNISSNPAVVGGRTVFTVANFSLLTNILNTLVEETCVTPTVPPTTTPALPTTPECREQADLVILLDASGSVQASNFNLMKKWIKTLILDLDIDGEVIRVGLLTFSRDAELRFHLNTYSNRKDILEAVDKVPYTHGTTNTADAIRYARRTMFTRQNGDRENVKNVILLLTNGQSNNRERTLEEATLAKNAGIHIFAGIIGNWYDKQEINAIASHPYERNKLELEKFSNLDRSFKDKMRRLICNTQNECAQNPCRNAIQCEDHLGYYMCVCSEGWGGVNCDRRCRDPVDIVFAVDASTSIGKQNFETVIDFVKDIIIGLRIGSSDSSRPTRVGLLTYSSSVKIQFNLNTHAMKYQVLNAFPPHYLMGRTNTAEAIKTIHEVMFTKENGDQPNAKNLAVIITDGYSGNEKRTWEQARLAREKGIDIITVGVGRSIRMRELQAMASYPNVEGQNVLKVENFNALASIKDAIVRAACGNSNRCNSNQCRNGATCLNRVNGFQCQCNGRYTGKFCERECKGDAGKVDIVFALDTSGSIRRERFPIVQKFVKGIVENLEIGQNKTRVGVVSWSDGTTIDFNLKDFNLKGDVLQAIEYIEFKAGKTHTSSAIQVMRNQMFTEQNGDRPDVPNYAYVITDGNSNINKQRTIKEAIEARVKGIHIMTVSVGQQLNMIELKGMASDAVSSNMFSVEKFDDLSSLTNRMPREICDNQNECRSSPCQAGGTCIDSLKRYLCICPEGRTGYNCQFSCRKSMDLVIMLDLSGSTEDEFDRAVRFSKRVVYGVDMSFGRTRVGVVTYGDRASIQFNLNEYKTKEEVINAMRFVPNIGRTNTQDAISRMRNDMFRSSNGDRSGVDNVGLLITDGRSNINKGNTIPEADRAKEEGISMYVAAVGTQVDMGEVNDIAGTANTPPNEFVFSVRNNQEADFIADRLVERLCQ